MHTLGPWKGPIYIAIAGPRDDDIPPDANFYVILSADPRRMAEARANLRLAYAAPDLLAALEPFERFLAKGLEGHSPDFVERKGDDFHVVGWNGALITLGELRRARAAIAKAKGGEK